MYEFMFLIICLLLLVLVGAEVMNFGLSVSGEKDYVDTLFLLLR